MVPVVPCLALNIKKGNTGSISRDKKHVMDKDIIPSKSEVIGRCGWNGRNPNDHAEPTKVERLENKI